MIQVQSGPRTHSSVFCPGRGICGWISSSDDIPPSVFSTGALLFFFLFTFFSFFFFPPFSPSELPLPPSSPSSLLPFPFFPPFFFFFFFLSSAMAAWSPFFFLLLQSSFRQAEKMKNYWLKKHFSEDRRINEGNGLDLNISLLLKIIKNGTSGFYGTCVLSFENMFLTQISSQVVLLVPSVPLLNHLLILLYQYITLTDTHTQ